MLSSLLTEITLVLAQIPVVQKGLAREEIDEDIVHADVSMDPSTPLVRRIKS